MYCIGCYQQMVKHCCFSDKVEGHVRVSESDVRGVKKGKERGCRWGRQMGQRIGGDRRGGGGGEEETYKTRRNISETGTPQKRTSLDPGGAKRLTKCHKIEIIKVSHLIHYQTLDKIGHCWGFQFCNKLLAYWRNLLLTKFEPTR